MGNVGQAGKRHDEVQIDDLNLGILVADQVLKE